MPVTRHITGGSLFIYQPGLSLFALESTDFAIRFELADFGSIPMPEMKSQGQTLNLSGYLGGGQTLRYGEVDYGGKVYPRLWFEGDLHITATPFIVPANSSHPIHHTTPFELTGTLKAFMADNISGNGGPAVFDYSLYGNGKVSVRLGPFSGNRPVTSYFYSFT